MAAGRPKKYTAKAFREAVDAWFRSITVEVQEDDVINLDGDPVTKMIYAVPPTISGLCIKLGIDRSTWQNYADEEENPKHAAVCADVRLRIEAYLEEQLLTREKSLQGIIFNLQNNYGWKERHEHAQTVEIGEKTRESLAMNLSMDEKLAAIRAAAEEIGTVDDEGGAEEYET